MARERIQAVRVHPAPPPDGAALTDGVNQIYARYVRRCLEESGMSAAEKDTVLQALIAELHGRPS